jgi:hypothetical protein
MMMRVKYLSTLKTGLFAAVVALGASFVGNAPAVAQTYVKAGVLTCSVSGGVGLIITSAKALNCTFVPDNRGPEHYTGTIRKFGLDIGATKGAVIVWAVLAPVSGLEAGGLGGTYGGVSAEASVVIGAGANVLVGGSNRTVALQPLSVQGQVGLNIAAGVTSMQLFYAP